MNSAAFVAILIAGIEEEPGLEQVPDLFVNVSVRLSGRTYF
jgi:hypothetical protein